MVTRGSEGEEEAEAKIKRSSKRDQCSRVERTTSGDGSTSGEGEHARREKIETKKNKGAGYDIASSQGASHTRMQNGAHSSEARVRVGRMTVDGSRGGNGGEASGR